MSEVQKPSPFDFPKFIQITSCIVENNQGELYALDKNGDVWFFQDFEGRTLAIGWHQLNMTRHK
jgi:hypothetical protein